jgi:hypothetical protein
MVRRLGVPAVMAVSLSFSSLWLLLTFFPLWGIVSIGYGMPSEGDKGSAMGRFWLKLLPYKAANWATRFSIFALFNIVCITALAITK